METATELSWFVWKHEVADKDDCAMLFTCLLDNRYKLLVWAIRSDRQSESEQEISYYWRGKFNFQIMRDYDDIAEHTQLEMTESILYDASLPIKHDAVERSDLLQVLNKLGGERKGRPVRDYGANKPLTVNKAVCSECNGTKVIDTGFYKRTCMKCFEE